MPDLFQSLRPQTPSDPGTLLPLGRATLDALTPEYMRQPTGPITYPSQPGKMATVDPRESAWPMAAIDLASMLPTGGMSAFAGKGLGLAALHLIPLAEEHTKDIASKLFNIVNDSGKEVASAALRYDPELKRVWVHGIASNEGPQSIGWAETRSLLSALKRQYPEAESVAGIRISGARKVGSPKVYRPSEMVTVPLPETP